MHFLIKYISDFGDFLVTFFSYNIIWSHVILFDIITIVQKSHFYGQFMNNLKNILYG